MPYDANIPQPNPDAPKTSRVEIHDNFAAIFTFFGVNHNNFNTLNAGYHSFAQMPQLLAEIDPDDPASNLQCLTGPISGIPELFFSTIVKGDFIKSFPLTEATLATTGYVYLPSGLVMKWGLRDLTAAQAAIDTEYAVSLPVAPIISTTLWGIVVPASNPATPNVDPVAAVYVTTIDSNNVNFKIWARVLANSPGNFANADVRVYGLLIGEP